MSGICIRTVACCFCQATFKGWIDIMKHAIDIREASNDDDQKYFNFVYLYIQQFLSAHISIGPDLLD